MSVPSLSFLLIEQPLSLPMLSMLSSPLPNGEDFVTEKEEKQITVDSDSLKITTDAMNYHPPLQVRLKKQPSAHFKSTSLPSSDNSLPRRFTASFEGNQHDHLRGKNSFYIPSMRKSLFLDHDSIDRSKSFEVNERPYGSTDEFELRKGIRREKIDYKSSMSYYNDKYPISMRSVSCNKNNIEGVYNLKKLNHQESSFNCRGFCMFLPGLWKEKQAKKKNREFANENHGLAMSTKISLDKFECGSWSSSAIMDNEGGSHVNAYFNPSSKPIRSNSKNTRSPASTAFLSNNEMAARFNNVPKKGTSSLPRLVDSSHDLFISSPSPSRSSSSPSNFVISPRLRKARDDFNALLKSQTYKAQ